jgi:hypothetical protein
MLFVQTAAPTGWTKSTAHDDKALRVVSGTASSGGSVAFTTAFASQTPAGTVSVSGGSVGATTLSTNEMPNHTHNYRSTANSAGNFGFSRISNLNNAYVNTNNIIETTGGGGSHSHGFTTPTATFSGAAINLAVQYVDVIIATKD